MRARVFKSTAFSPIAPNRIRLTGYDYHAFPLDFPFDFAVPTTDDWDCVFETRQRGGEATLCGFSEYTTPSTPPKKYRIQTASGEIRICYFASPVCAGNTFNLPGSQSFNLYRGTYEYSADDCTETNNSFKDASDCEFTVQGCGLACGALTDVQVTTPLIKNWSAGFYVGGGTSTVTTPTTVSYITDGICGTNGAGIKQVGTAVKTLSVEDDDDDAIARLLASSPGADWSAWTNAGGLYATYEERTGFTFDYFQAQYRITGTGLLPNKVYPKIITVSRRAFGTADPFVLFSTETVEGTSDNDGNIAITGDFPNEIDWEYDVACESCAICPAIEVQPVNDTAPQNSPAGFSVIVDDDTGVSYQWQVNTGSGWSDALDGPVYSGVNTADLIIGNATLGMNGYLYRCVITKSGCEDLTSSQATLTVTSGPPPPPPPPPPGP